MSSLKDFNGAIRQYQDRLPGRVRCDASLEFYEQDHIQTLLWARTLDDTPMILGALTFTVGAV